MRAPLAILLLAVLALAGCSGGKGDKDGDGISDAQERHGLDVRVDYLHERVSYHAKSNPKNSDTDGDGLPDNEEYLLGLDPGKADTDEDGLTDCQEERHTNRTECEDPPEGLGADGGYGTDPRKADSDSGSGRYVRQPGWFTDATGTLSNGPESGDGVSDGDEVLGYAVVVAGGATRTVKTDPRDADFDNDGLGDGEEREYHGDPTVPDTDGDGCEDGGDPFPDRDERLQPGFADFTLSATFGRTVEVRFRAFVAGANVDAGTATVRVQPGETVQVPAMVAVRPPSCTFPAYQSMVGLQPFVSEADGTPLDVTSGNPGGSGSLAWDLRAGTFAWGNVATTGTPLSSVGQAGTLRFSPSA